MNKKVVHLDNTSIVQLDSINIKAWAENRVKIPSVEVCSNISKLYNILLTTNLHRQEQKVAKFKVLKN